MGHREQAIGATDEWYTPARVFEALGCTFDMDVASPGGCFTPQIPAKAFITHDSLNTAWRGFVWMNAPFGGRGNKTVWLEKFFRHGNGIALVPDRTSAPWWVEWVPRADLVLFVAPKIQFIPGAGQQTSAAAQGTALLAAGRRACNALERARDNGLGTLMRPV